MPSATDGKICYLEIPAADVSRSAAFYQSVFGWKTRTRGDGALAFDDSTGQVSGSWVTGRPHSSAAGLLVYIMVDDAEEAVERIGNAGGVIVQPIGADAPEITARFLDPAGNIMGIYQEPSEKAA